MALPPTMLPPVEFRPLVWPAADADAFRAQLRVTIAAVEGMLRQLVAGQAQELRDWTGGHRQVFDDDERRLRADAAALLDDLHAQLLAVDAAEADVAAENARRSAARRRWNEALTAGLSGPGGVGPRRSSTVP